MLSLHRHIPDNELPEVLKKPLIFGDRKQINALNDLAVRINEATAREAVVREGKLRRFSVTISYGATIDVDVLAIDRDDAKEKARENADMDRLDMEIDSISVDEIK